MERFGSFCRRLYRISVTTLTRIGPGQQSMICQQQESHARPCLDFGGQKVSESRAELLVIHPDSFVVECLASKLTAVVDGRQSDNRLWVRVVNIRCAQICV